MFKKLHRRLTAVCTIITGLVLVAMSLVSLHFSEQQLTRRAEESFLNSITSIFFYLRGQVSIDHAWLAQTEQANGLFIRIEDHGHPLLYTQNNPKRDMLTANAKQYAADRLGYDSKKGPSTSLSPDMTLFLYREGGESYRAAACAVPVSQTKWLGVTILKSMQAEQAQVLQLRLTFAGCTAGAVLCLFLFAWIFTKRAIRPVEQVRQRQTEFVSAASHELRSPLAVMRASAGAMQTAPPDMTRRFAKTIEEECARLSRLTDDLLLLAGADSSRWTIQPEAVELETLLLSVSERFEPLAREKQISLLVSLPDDILPRCRCDRQRIEQLLAVLLDNAISYTPAGGKISLAAKRLGHSLCLTVADNGPGIPDAQKAHIFERFYRADASRSKKKHYGLGLSIAWEIAALHRGSLTVSDAPGGGAAFTLMLPIDKKAAEL